MEDIQKAVEQSTSCLNISVTAENGLSCFTGLDSSFELNRNKEPLSFAVK